VSAPILRPAPVVNKLTFVKCPTCDYGLCPPGTNCAACLDAHRQSEEARARSRGKELIARLAAVIDARPAELCDALLAELAPGMAEVADTVIDEREATA